MSFYPRPDKDQQAGQTLLARRVPAGAVHPHYVLADIVVKASNMTRMFAVAVRAR